MPSAISRIIPASPGSDARQDSIDWLLQLPETVLESVLQLLDQSSLACSSASSSILKYAALRIINKADVRWKASPAANSFPNWLAKHHATLPSFTELSIAGDLDDKEQAVLDELPCPGLRQLRLQGMKVQLGTADGIPGLLHDCSSLTALDLQGCIVIDSDAVAGAAAIAALPQLQRLQLSVAWGWKQDKALFAELQLPLQLTHLSLGCGLFSTQDLESLSQLSGLVNLQHLELTQLPEEGLPDGGLSQLVQLTCLWVHSDTAFVATAEQFQHLSSLTALQELSVRCKGLKAEHLSGMEYLSLTSLDIQSNGFDFSTTSTQNWYYMTALQTLSLSGCTLEPATLLTLPQLQKLHLSCVICPRGDPLKQLLEAVSQLTLLTELRFAPDTAGRGRPPPQVAAAFTSLTASTNLRSLQLCLRSEDIPKDWELFKPGTMYPHLRVVNLQYKWSGAAALGEQQLQQLCKCCPAIEELAFAVPENLSRTALLPLQLHLPELTHLVMSEVDAAVATVVIAAAQLTGLKQLVLTEVPELLDRTLLQLTALRTLERLVVTSFADADTLEYRNMSSWSRRSDVWVQLGRTSRAGAVQQAAELQQRSSLSSSSSSSSSRNGCSQQHVLAEQ